MSKLLANQIANFGDDAPIEIKEGLNIPAGKPIQVAGSAGASGQVLSSTGASIQWINTFDGDYNNLSNRPTIPAAQVNSDWDASSGVAVILNKPAVPPLPSVTTASAGSAALAYNSGNGEFTFTPPDLSNASNWDTAYGWGNHASAGYLTAEADTLDTVISRGATTSVKIIANGGVRASVLGVGGGIGNGDVQLQHNGTTHVSTLGHYNINGSFDIISVGKINLKPGSESGNSVDIYHNIDGSTEELRIQTTDTGVTISGDITTTDKVYFSNNFATLGDLPNATTYHGMFAHVHAEGHGYFAHAGAWTQLLDTSSSIDELGNVDLSIAPTDGYVLKWEASSSSWRAFPDLVGTSNAGITLQDLSVQTAAAGSTALSYSNTTGVFTYTPPDLSSYAQTANLTIANWDTAYGWGNHASAGYLVATAQDKTNWDLSYGWGDHAGAGYLTAEADTLDTVTGRGATTTNTVQVGRLDINGTSQSIIPSVNNGVTFQNTFTGGTILLRAAGDVEIQSYQGSSLLKTNTSSGTTGGIKLYYATGLTSEIERLATTSNGVTINGVLIAGGLTYPSTNGTSGDVLTSDGAGNVTWAAPTGGGGGGANVTISDTIPAGTPAAGDLWWESDSGRLKVYYTDVDSSQWIDASPPLTQDRIASSSAPSSATDTGTPGDIRYDSSYVYICISNNTWKRAALTTW